VIHITNVWSLSAHTSLPCALLPLQALCQFRPLEEIGAFVQIVPEFAAIVGTQVAAALQTDEVVPRGAARKHLLRKAFTTYARTSSERVHELAATLCARLQSSSGELSSAEKV
jgi:mannose-6-phosphate isomerase